MSRGANERSGWRRSCSVWWKKPSGGVFVHQRQRLVSGRQEQRDKVGSEDRAGDQHTIQRKLERMSLLEVDVSGFVDV
jgi:hypothetical protein